MRFFVSLILALALVGCGGEDTPTGHEADVAFATGMIPHHAQALVMVDMAAGREVSPEFTALTEKIRAAQTPEIEEMVDWLEEWGEDIPEPPRDHVNAGHGDEHMGDGHGGDGMMSGEDMEKLHGAGADFESMWLTMMIEHHEGAIEMSRDEIDHGKDPRAIKLAKSIVKSQQAEIDTMESMLQD